MNRFDSGEAEAARSDSPRRSLELSLMFFSADEESIRGMREGKYNFVMDAVDFADDAGFTAVWFPERHFHRFGGLFPSPAILAAAAAARTRKLRLRAGSVVLPLHDVLRVREDWAVVDNLSGGRVDLAFAAGWDANSFCLSPDHYANRQQITFEGIEQFQRLWAGESISRVNGNKEVVSITPRPRPIQSMPGIWSTVAQQPNLFVEAGKRKLNLLTAMLFQHMTILSENVRLYRQARQESGLDPGRGCATLMLHTFVGETDKSAVAAVSKPLHKYLESSIDLWRSESLALNELTPKERDTVIELAFQRYVRHSGLIGSVETVAKRLAEIRAIDVDEVACLIDFGVDEDEVLASLPRLAAAWTLVAPPVHK